jgi:hypothetical protein
MHKPLDVRYHRFQPEPGGPVLHMPIWGRVHKPTPRWARFAGTGLLVVVAIVAGTGLGQMVAAYLP